MAAAEAWAVVGGSERHVGQVSLPLAIRRGGAARTRRGMGCRRAASRPRRRTLQGPAVRWPRESGRSRAPQTPLVPRALSRSHDIVGAARTRPAPPHAPPRPLTPLTARLAMHGAHGYHEGPSRDEFRGVPVTPHDTARSLRESAGFEDGVSRPIPAASGGRGFVAVSGTPSTSRGEDASWWPCASLPRARINELAELCPRGARARRASRCESRCSRTPAAGRGARR